MRNAVIVVSVVLLWGFLAAVLIGVPVVVFFCPDGLLSEPEWVTGVVRLVGYGVFVLWLLGTEVYLRVHKEGAQ
ncbi:hypothetical protein [Cohaesibacter haloalkalitolerans]|uniref:hypothetical protein n=1 Tax=Cohaesibacter haloalkalitolerans TaxID=1162980 RepID=UPI000E649224|nr:hypothetical protein [Cohaesibacter haloalkalitolerans]